VELYADEKKFASLFESVAQMDEIVRGERKKSREFHIDALGVIGIRKETGTQEVGSSHGYATGNLQSRKPRQNLGLGLHFKRAALVESRLCPGAFANA
jgi:hypothetical protein